MCSPRLGEQRSCREKLAFSLQCGQFAYRMRYIVTRLAILSAFSLISCGKGEIGGVPPPAIQVDLGPQAKRAVDALVERRTATLRGVKAEMELIRQAWLVKEAWLSIARTYIAAELGFYIVQGGSFSTAGGLLLERLESIRDHGIDPAGFRLGEVRSCFENLEIMSAETGAVAANRCRGVTAEVEALIRQKLGSDPLGSGDLDDRELVDLLSAEVHEGRLPALSAFMDQLEEGHRELSRMAARCELVLAVEWYRYLESMGALARPEELEEIQEEREREALLAGRYVDFAVKAAEDMADALAISEPSHPQYRKLVKTVAFYRERVRSGEVVPLPFEVGAKEKIELGQQGPKVKGLKQRLAAEDFYDGPMDEVFDQKLHDAVVAFQQAHQLLDDGVVGLKTAKVMDISMQDKLDRIILNIRRWRRIPVGCAPGLRKPECEDYVWVNIPEFWGELYEKGKLTHRFKVVVGNTRWGYDEVRKRSRLINSTPRMSEKIRHIVFNPYWRVPNRIKEQELDPKLEENPDYYIERNYELFIDKNGTERVFQKSGRGNALGKVKIIFPNRHDTYMHDTPYKSLFQKTRRAFSHGCMRAQEPMELVKRLLKMRGQWNPKKVRWYLRDPEKKEHWVTLRSTIPIHVEYVTVRVDPDGRTQFFGDLYRLDRPHLARMKKEREEAGGIVNRE